MGALEKEKVVECGGEVSIRRSGFPAESSVVRQAALPRTSVSASLTPWRKRRNGGWCFLYWPRSVGAVDLVRSAQAPSLLRRRAGVA